MAMSIVQRAIKFSVDRLGCESLKPDRETVVGEFLGDKNVFAPLAYGLRQIVVLLALFSTLFDCL